LLLDRGTDKIAICSFHLFNFFSGVQRMATLRPLMSVLASSLAANVMLLSPAAADAPFAFDTTPGRLPKNVVPIDYQIAVVPDVKAKTFTGTESVSLKFRAATATVIFNTLNLTLTGVRLDGKPVKQVASDNNQGDSSSSRVRWVAHPDIRLFRPNRLRPAGFVSSALCCCRRQQPGHVVDGDGVDGCSPHVRVLG
jgi:hypothetical protein